MNGMRVEFVRRMAAGLLAAALAPWASAEVKISAVYFDTLLSGEPDEAVELINTGAASVDISFWSVDDGSTASVVFPAGTVLAPLGRIWVTNVGTAFTNQFGRPPDFETTESDPAILNVSGAWPGFANAGDEAFLRDSGGALVDVVIYGNSAYAGPGWSGPPAQLDLDLWGGVAGQVLERNRLENQEGVVPDTDTAEDFHDARVYDAGASHFLGVRFTEEMTITAAAAPDNNFAALIAAIEGAKSSLHVNVYEFTNTYIAEKLVEALGRGVAVKVLLEGGPVGGISDQEKWIATRIEDAGGEVYFMINDSANSIYDRYQFNHAKYTIVDGTSVVIGSENYGHTGHPNDPSYGNRGWEAHLESPSLAAWFTTVYFTDLDAAHGDIKRYEAAHPDYGAPPAGFAPDTTIPTSSYTPLAGAEVFTGTFTVEPVLSPDHALMQNYGPLHLINTAEGTLFVEHLYMHKYWGPQSTGSPATTPNLVLEAVIDASRRGVQVRVLLDSSFYNTDPDNPRDNDDTVKYLNATAAAEGLPLEARLINLSATKVEKIHNKGITVGGNKTLVSSINGSENSHKRNREAGVVITSQEVADYYLVLLNYDWDLSAPGSSAGLPGSVVINEVAWMGTVANALDEWIELYNTACEAIDVSGWYILDDDGAQTYALPPGSLIAPHGYFLVEDREAATDVPADAIITLSLANAGDSLKLYDAVGNIIDAVNGTGGAWYAGSNSGEKPSMERRDACTPTDTASNWASNDGSALNGLDAAGNPVRGTPRAANSVRVETCSVCAGAVEAEVMFTEILPEAGSVRVRWTDGKEDPDVDHYHLYATDDPTLESNWHRVGGELYAPEYLDAEAAPMRFYIAVAVAVNGDTESEGPSGHYDGWFDR